jgi:SAM-dependent methyltransferase
MNPNQALWEKGDFTQIASFMRESGEGLARSLNVSKQMRVLDLGCGDGTTAVPLAKLGAEVLGVDIAQNLVAAGNRRAKEAGLDRLKIQQGDACQLQGIPDASFDLTVSIFGAMFAPKPFDVAKEMVRVTKPGGRIVMGNWIPNDPGSFASELLRESMAFMPPPPEGFVSPMLWGVESNVLERFGKAGIPKDRVQMKKDVYLFDAPIDAERFVDVFHRYYGPTMNAFEAAEKSGRGKELEDKLVALARKHNKSPNGSTHIEASFLRVTVTR